MAYTPTTYTGTYTHIASTTTSYTAPGSTRWNTTTNSYELFDGINWIKATDGGTVKALTLAEWIEEAQDRVGSYVDEDHKDNITIQDAYQEWVSACERFRVVAAMVEK